MKYLVKKEALSHIYYGTTSLLLQLISTNTKWHIFKIISMFVFSFIYKFMFTEIMIIDNHYDININYWIKSVKYMHCKIILQNILSFSFRKSFSYVIKFSCKSWSTNESSGEFLPKLPGIKQYTVSFIWIFWKGNNNEISIYFWKIISQQILIKVLFNSNAKW